MRKRFPVLFAAMHGVLWAQAPQVTAVLNAVTRDAHLSPGVRAQVNFAPISATPTAVTVGGLPARMVGTTVGSGSMVVLLPREMGPGATTLVLADMTGVSAPFAITLDSVSPGLVPTASEGCSAGQPDIVLTALGLGPTSPLLPTLDEGHPVPPSTTNVPRLTIGRAEAVVTSSVLLPQSYGVYQVTANLPPDLPGGLWPAVLTIDGKNSNQLNLVVGLTTQLAVPYAAIGKGAPEAIMAVKGCSDVLRSGVTVRVKDSSGTEREAPLYPVAPDESRFVMPKETQIGPAIITVQSSTGTSSNSAVDVQTVEPGILGYSLVRVRNGVQTIEAVPSSLEVDLGPETDQVYLILLATGVRGRSSLSNVHATILSREPNGGPETGPVADAPVEYAGPQLELAGLDQVNVRLPRSIAGFGRDSDNGASITLQVDAKALTLTGFSFR